jgi:hypothetical protein
MNNKIYAIKYNGRIDYFMCHRSRHALKRMIVKYLHIPVSAFFELGGSFVKVSSTQAEKNKCLF